MVIGLLIFGVFLAYSLIMLFLDDKKNHKDYDNEIKKCKNNLQTNYNCEEEEI